MKVNRIGIVCALLVASAALRSQETGLSGFVVDADGRGVPDAAVMLRDRTGGGDARIVGTDSQGQFRFVAVSASRYLVSVAKAGFVRDDRVRVAMDSGYVPPGSPIDGIDVWIREGETPDPVVLSLVRQAVVGGTVFDADGEPLQGCRVVLYRYDREGDSFRLIQKSFSATSDDRGQYRLASLTPGRYYVVAERNNLVERERTLSMFYPGEADFGRAVPVDLLPGESRLNVNILMRSQKGLHIRGQVVDESGRPVPGSHVWAIPDGGAFDGIAVSRLLYHAEAPVDEAGRFDFGTFPTRGLPAGTYTLKALGPVADPKEAGAAPNEHNLMGLGPRGVEAGGSFGYGAASVVIRGADVEGVTLRLRSPKTLSGTVRLPGGEPVQNVAVKFEAERFSEAMLLGVAEFRSDPDGVFTFPNAWAARFHVSVANLPAGMYVESITHSGRDLLSGPLDHSEPTDGRIEVVLSPFAGEFAGVVRKLDGSAAMGAQVFVWPKTLAGGDGVVGASTDRDGRFRIRNLAPGEYFAVAAEVAGIQLMRDPRFREAIRRNSVEVTLDKSGRVEDMSLRVASKELVLGLAAALE